MGAPHDKQVIPTKYFADGSAGVISENPLLDDL